MKFTYQEMPCEPSEAFPKMRTAFRPVIPVTIRNGTYKVEVFALIDSGADFCVFPSEACLVLGIDECSGKKTPVQGVGRSVSVTYYHEVEMEIAGHKMPLYVGFTSVPIPLLGQIGFFDRWCVKMDYGQKSIEITPRKLSVVRK